MSKNECICTECDDEQDVRSAYCQQADYYGMDSLTENQQALVRGSISYERFLELERES